MLLQKKQIYLYKVYVLNTGVPQLLAPHELMEAKKKTFLKYILTDILIFWYTG